MVSWAESLLSPDQRADECTLEKECKHSFHRQGLADHSARILGELGPVSSELKLHRNTSYNSHGEIESKNLCPEANSSIVFFIASSQGTPFPIHKKPRESHCEL